MKRSFLFFFLWLGWGFTLGTLVLLGPLRWTVNWGRSHQWTEGQENVRVYILIALVALLSFLAARSTAAYVLNREKHRLRFLWFLLPLLGAGVSVYAFMHPRWMNSGREEAVGTQFTIGPYPEADKLSELKKARYTTVVSLLHPAVVPFEPKLIAAEEANARALGLNLVNIPMLPWISDKTAALDHLRSLVQHAKGKIYIHCYLGKDRVNVARRIIEQESQHAGFENGAFHYRSLDTVRRFERGPVYRLEDQVFFTPFPTKEEYLGYVLAGNVRQVVSLVNLSEPGARSLMEDEKKTLEKMKISFRVYDVSTASPAAMKANVSEVRQLPKPMIVHPFFSDSKEGMLFRDTWNKR